MKAGLRQPDLGVKLNCTAMTISRYERGEADPDIETICRLCDVFGCTADYLLGRSDLPSAELTPEEVELLLAWRAADDHDRAIVSTTLAPYKEESSSSAAV